MSFYHDHGIDVRTQPFWSLARNIEQSSVESEDPVTVRVDIRIETEILRLTVDESPSVINTEYV
uniref:DUF7351 domain-containing protein n=1 Tax=Halocatena halophila TaxID=2814576 RepID=UPI002ED2D950